jgi:hypothetical protein
MSSENSLRTLLLTTYYLLMVLGHARGPKLGPGITQ